MGPDQSCSTYSFMGGVLKDADGDIIPTRNIKNEGDENSSEADDDDEEEYVPAGSRRRGITYARCAMPEIQ